MLERGFMLSMLDRGSMVSMLDIMLEALLFIAAASAMLLMAKAKRVNKVSRRFPIIGKVGVPCPEARRLVLKLPLWGRLYTRIASAFLLVALTLIAYPGVAKPMCRHRESGLCQLGSNLLTCLRFSISYKEFLTGKENGME